MNTPSLGASSPSSLGIAATQFDPQRPFKHVVVCCTSIPQDERAVIDKAVSQLGGIHKYDLTPDVTHLVVGNYDTPKYRHVAKARPDIIPVAAGWIQATLDLWKQDREMDFAALESTWRLKVLESSGGPLLAVTSSGAPDHRVRLLVCLTGFDDPTQRQSIITQIDENGGIYTGDLTKKVTHLIVRKPEGRKYIAARSWQVNCVALKWLEDSTSRGMILDESLYDPLLPAEKLGVGAWTNRDVAKVALGKRSRDGAVPAQEDASRKLRKTASMKLQSQSQSMWASILGASTPADYGVMPRSDEFVGASRTALTQPTERSEDALPKPAEDGFIFASSVFFAHGYIDKQLDIIANVIRSFGGRLCATLDEAAALDGSEITHRFLVVPQNSQPDTHPLVPDGFAIVTEFYLEKCLHKKRFFDPKEHVLGKPFPVFPIPQFAPLSVAIGGFTDMDLQQVEKAITQLGATFVERFTKQAHVLVCSGLAAVRPKKINLALTWKVPIVGADWLWDSIQVGSRAPLKKYLIKELHQQADTELPDAPREVEGRLGAAARSFSADIESARDRRKLDSALANKANLKGIASEPAGKKIGSKSVLPDDVSGFDDDPGRSGMSEEASFKTAQTHATSRICGTLRQEQPPSEGPFNTAARTRQRLTTLDVDMVSDGFHVSTNEHASGWSLSRWMGRGMTEGQSSFAHRPPSPPIDNRKRPENLSRDDVLDEGITMLEGEGSAVSFPDVTVRRGAATIVAEVEVQEIHAERESRERDEWEEKTWRRADKMVQTTNEAKAARKKQERMDIERKLMSSILSDHGGASTGTGEGDGLGETEKGLQRAGNGHTGRWKQGVFGRAFSGASIASHGSASDQGTGAANAQPPRRQDASSKDAARTVGGVISEYAPEDTLIMDSGSGSGASAAAPPPVTQIGYSDPEAKNVREIVLKRMRGEPCEEAEMKMRKEEEEERITIMGFDRPSRDEEAAAEASGVGTRTRARARRVRRPGF